jgi:hypothetical protein
MTESGKTIEQVFKNARREVLAKTQNKQIPWENSSIVGDFYFKPKPEEIAKPIVQKSIETKSSVAKPSTVDPRAIELAYWDAIKDSNNADLFKSYLSRYPKGIFAAIANVRMKPPAEIKQATLTPPDEKKLSEQNGQVLARALQTELKRVGCYLGKIDGDWGRGSTAAMSKYNKHGKVKLNTHTPSHKTVAMARKSTLTVCSKNTQNVVRKVLATPRHKSRVQNKSIGRCLEGWQEGPNTDPC